MRLARAIGFRLLYGILSLLFISFATFVANNAAPGDPALVIAGEKASLETIQRIRHNMHLDQNWLIRYGYYLDGLLVHGDLGTSYYGIKEPVSDIVKRNLPWTLRLASLAMLLAASIGIFLGTLAAVWQNRFPDRSILLVSTLGVTLPNFVVAPVLVYIFALQMDRLPMNWEPRAGGDWHYFVLPVIVLALRPMAMLTRLTRASMVDTLQQEFVRMAIAKGVPPFRLYIRHALRNAILPVITAIGTSFGFLLTGSFVVETFFTLPGIGREAIESMRNGDYPVISACVLITGAMFIGLNLLVDMILPFLDPRIREAQV